MPLSKQKLCFQILDYRFRYDAFKLAVHYWEDRWILETYMLPTLFSAYLGKTIPLYNSLFVY